MIRITDVTLCTLDYEAAPKQKLMEIYSLLLQTGISHIEIDIPLFELLGNVVDETKTILRVQHPAEIKSYTGFVGYVCRFSGFETPPQAISEIQVNDVREINLLNRFASYENVRIIGLDDLLMYDYVNTFTKIKRIFRGRLELCPQNRYFCATALAAEWVLNEGENIVASFFGAGGFAALEELIMILRIAKRHKPNLNLSVFREIKKLYEELTGCQIPRNKAVIGDHIFDVESGIHVDGILKNGSNYEPFEPSVVGMTRRIVVGKHSGRSTMELKLKEQGILLPEEKIPLLLERVQQESIWLGRSLTDKEFAGIARKLSIHVGKEGTA
jgi:Isopropylmalate/homocitrate/citramalate synthases